jgi:hypothetical protein
LPPKIQIHSLPACGPSQGVPPYDPAKNKYYHSKEMMIMKNETVRIRVRLTEEEKEKLERDAALCGLSQAEYVRQICKGKKPPPQPGPDFWDLLEEIYHVHDSLQKCVRFLPETAEECRRIEALILTLVEVA